MDQRDLEAMRLAIEMLRKDPEERDSIEAMLRSQLVRGRRLSDQKSAFAALAMSPL